MEPQTPTPIIAPVEFSAPKTDAPMSPTPVDKSEKSPLMLGLGVVVVAIILALGFAYYKGAFSHKQSFSSENVSIKKVDPSSTSGTQRLPEGFPAGTPVELENITQSETLTYPDRHVAISNVAYYSTKQLEELSVVYATYLKSAGYTVLTSDKSVAHTIYTASKGASTFNVLVTPQGGTRRVTLSYMVTK